MLTLDNLKEELDILKGRDALSSLRQRAWDSFLKVGLPQRSQEAFQYLPLSQLYAATFEKSQAPALEKEALLQHVCPECRQSYLVFVDGQFRSELSDTSALPKQIVISNLPDAMSSYGNFIEQRWQMNLQEERDPFALLNAALHPRALFLYIPPKLKVEAPIQLLNIISGCAAPRIQMIVGAHSEVRCISTLVTSNENPLWVNSLLDVVLEQGAQFYHVDLPILKNQQWLFSSLRATLKQSSCFRSISAIASCKTVRQSYHVALTGENAEAALNGIWTLNAHAQAHVHVLMDHQAPHCRSYQSFKGVLNDASQSSFEGKIYVRREAQKTEAYQLNNNLLLGERALANSKPNLEIFADDVKASHGATTGRLDPDQLLYLRTRGIPENLAKHLLVQGFCQQMIDLIPYASIRNILRNNVRNIGN